MKRLIDVYADVARLVGALNSGSSDHWVVGVQVPPSAPLNLDFDAALKALKCGNKPLLVDLVCVRSYKE